ncbi:hypothetical protein D3C84_1077350 [compost metagenome]
MPDSPVEIFRDSKLPKILNPSVVPIAWNNCTVATPTPLCSFATDSCTIRLSEPNRTPIPNPKMKNPTIMYITVVST